MGSIAVTRGIGQSQARLPPSFVIIFELVCLAKARPIFSLLLLLATLSVGEGAEGSPTFLWAKGSAPAGNGGVGAIATDVAGNAHVAGYFTGTVSFGTNQLTSISGLAGFIAKLDPDGNFLWVRSVTGSNECIPYSLALDNQGNSYVVGLFRSTGTFGTNTLVKPFGDRDAFITKLDREGNFLWAVRAGADGDDSATSVAADGAGGIFLGGYFERTVTFGSAVLTNGNFLPYGEAFVARLDGAGNFLWAKRAGGNDDHYLLSVSSDTGGNAYVAGSSRGFVSFGTNTVNSGSYFNAFTAKLDRSGNYLWVRQSGGGTNSASDMQAFAISVDEAGRINVAGSFNGAVIVGTNVLTSTGGPDIFVTQLDSDGDYRWAVSGGGGNYDAANALTVDRVGSIYVAGTYKSSASFGHLPLNNTDGAEDAFIAKLDRDGHYLWAVAGGGTNRDQAFGLAVDVLGNVFVGGYQTGTAFFGTNALAGSSGSPFFARLVAAPPVLSANRVGNGLDLHWPDTTLGFFVETASSLSSPVIWRSDPSALQTNGGTISLAIPISEARKFYRLVRP